MTKTVVALDIGAGNMKFMASKDGTVVASGHMPSVVSLATAGSLSSFLAGRSPTGEVAPVIEGVTYKVSLIQNQGVVGATRVAPGDDFQKSAHHTALLAAGLHAAGLPHIDALVLGTPVHTFDKHRDRLTAVSGAINYGLGSHHIDTTIVLPQPFGSLLAGVSEGFLPNDAHGAAQLVIDVGYYTIDVLRANGLTMENAHSFSLEAGTGRIYRMIADELAQRIRKPINNLDQIEFCLRTNTPYLAYGQQFFLGEFSRGIQAQLDALLLEIYGRAGVTVNISRIFLTGGGSELFLPAIKKMFGDIPIHVVRDPLMANVRGFLLAGESATADLAA